MPINNNAPVNLSATTFDKLYATSINITALRDANGKIHDAQAFIMLSPYNASSGEDLPAQSQHLFIKSIQARIAANPTGKLAQAWGAIVDAIAEEYLFQHPAP